MTTDNTTPAQAAGLKAYSRVYANGIFRDFNLAVDVDEMLRSMDQQIVKLVAALENLLGAENAFDEIAAIKDARHTLNALAQPAANPRNTTPHADTTATAGFDDDDDAVIAWRGTFIDVCDWNFIDPASKERWRKSYAAHIREQSAKGSES